MVCFEFKLDYYVKQCFSLTVRLLSLMKIVDVCFEREILMKIEVGKSYHELINKNLIKCIVNLNWPNEHLYLHGLFGFTCTNNIMMYRHH